MFICSSLLVLEVKNDQGFRHFEKSMPAAGAILESTIVATGPINVIQATRQGSSGTTTTIINLPDDREIFKVYLFINHCRMFIKYAYSF